MDLTSIVLAPVRLPLRLARALDDLTAIADRARRDPDPVEEALGRIDALLAEIDGVRHIGRTLNATMQGAIEAIEIIIGVAGNLDVTGQQIVVGGRDLTLTAKTLDRDTRELIDGGADLTEVARRLALDLQAFRAILPQVVDTLDTVERLEADVETVVETVEPLQGAAERVGRVTRRLSRSST